MIRGSSMSEATCRNTSSTHCRPQCATWLRGWSCSSPGKSYGKSIMTWRPMLRTLCSLGSPMTTLLPISTRSSNRWSQVIPYYSILRFLLVAHSALYIPYVHLTWAHFSCRYNSSIPSSTILSRSCYIKLCPDRYKLKYPLIFIIVPHILQPIESRIDG